MNLWPFKWVHFGIERMRYSNANHHYGVGVRLMLWTPHDPAWKARAEFEAQLDLVAWSVYVTGFLPHNAKSRQVQASMREGL